MTHVPDPPTRGVPLRNRPAAAGQPGPRHCWVTGTADAPGPWPGLVLDRRQRDGRWEGLVVYAVNTAGDVTLVQQWVGADLITVP